MVNLFQKIRYGRKQPTGLNSSSSALSHVLRNLLLKNIIGKQKNPHISADTVRASSTPARLLLLHSHTTLTATGASRLLNLTSLLHGISQTQLESSASALTTATVDSSGDDEDDSESASTFYAVCFLPHEMTTFWRREHRIAWETTVSRLHVPPRRWCPLPRPMLTAENNNTTTTQHLCINDSGAEVMSLECSSSEEYQLLRAPFQMHEPIYAHADASPGAHRKHWRPCCGCCIHRVLQRKLSLQKKATNLINTTVKHEQHTNDNGVTMLNDSEQNQPMEDYLCCRHHQQDNESAHRAIMCCLVIENDLKKEKMRGQRIERETNTASSTGIAEESASKYDDEIGYVEHCALEVLIKRFTHMDYQMVIDPMQNRSTSTLQVFKHQDQSPAVPVKKEDMHHCVVEIEVDESDIDIASQGRCDDVSIIQASTRDDAKGGASEHETLLREEEEKRERAALKHGYYRLGCWEGLHCEGRWCELLFYIALFDALYAGFDKHHNEHRLHTDTTSQQENPSNARGGSLMPSVALAPSMLPYNRSIGNACDPYSLAPLPGALSIQTLSDHHIYNKKRRATDSAPHTNQHHNLKEEKSLGPDAEASATIHVDYFHTIGQPVVGVGSFLLRQSGDVGTPYYYARRVDAVETCLERLQCLTPAGFARKVTMFPKEFNHLFHRPYIMNAVADKHHGRKHEIPHYYINGMPVSVLGRIASSFPSMTAFTALCRVLVQQSFGVRCAFSGFPDLVVWKNAPHAGQALALPRETSLQKRNSLRHSEQQPHGQDLSAQCYSSRACDSFQLVEIKGPNDALSDMQLAQHDVLIRCGFGANVSVCEVRSAAAKDMNKYFGTNPAKPRSR